VAAGAPRAFRSRAGPRSCPCSRAPAPAGAAGDGDHIRAPPLQDQVEAGAQPVPALLERRDAHVAAADFESDHARGGFLECANPCSNLRGIDGERVISPCARRPFYFRCVRPTGRAGGTGASPRAESLGTVPLVIAVGEYQAAVNRRKSPRTERVPLDLFSRVVPDDDVLAVPSSGAQEQRSGSSANGGGAAQSHVCITAIANRMYGSISGEAVSSGRHRIPKVIKGLVVDHRSFARAKYRATN
jgi:hypothetical protein